MKSARPTVSFVRRFGLSAALVTGLVTAATFTARAHDGHGYDAQPFYVAVKLEDRHGRHNAPALDQERLMASLARSLPRNVVLIDPRTNRTRPDMVLDVSERAYDVDFDVLDRDRADAPYRKGSYLPGCGPLYDASFTRVTERATARYSYDVRINNRFAPDFVATVQGQQSDRFKYGANLTAHGACGTVARAPIPADWVGDLFARDNHSTRSGLANGIRMSAAEDMGRKIADLIRNESNRVLEAHAWPNGSVYASAGRRR